VFVTAFTDEAARNTATSSGAICFLTKPFKEADLLDVSARNSRWAAVGVITNLQLFGGIMSILAETAGLDHDVAMSDTRPPADFPSPAPCAHTDGIVSRCPALLDALERVKRVAPTDATVLITGETGTGKELMARAIHRRSRRASRPMVTVNLAAIPEPLVASELFGHEHGAFTGAIQRRIGRFEGADRGTLFLDEIGDLSIDMQVSLLRAVQEGEFERLGASQTRRADVRLITATNRNLETQVEEGAFRADLFYRLSVFPLHLPPLRERCEDIPALAEYFLSRLQKVLARRFDGVEPQSMDRLKAFDWPGNIRQLENVIAQAAILCDEPVLKIPAALMTRARRPAAVPAGSRLAQALHHSEQQLIEQALTDAKGRVAGCRGAAARLDVPASTLESKIRRYRIDKLRFHARPN
jgi:formate hydrogenlyase transcriptional activator